MTTRFDFDALYRGESPAEGVPPMAPPWDTKGPKESVVGWQTSGRIRGDVLDIGCGLGDNAIYLARQGHQVTGLDISPTALSTAERRAADAGVQVQFGVADATKLEGYTDAFDTVIDSGMFHCLDDDGKRSYASALHRATRPNARLLLSCFCDSDRGTEDWPRPVVTQDTLRQVFGEPGWDIVSIEPTTVRRPDATEMGFFLVEALRR